MAFRALSGDKEVEMNTANLQLEGLIIAVAALTRRLVDKGVLDRGEIDALLATCEANISGSDRAVEDLSPANRDAVAFPIRMLRLANEQTGELDFGALAKRVGQTKGRYNDQQ
jgi:hypothetical protein